MKRRLPIITALLLTVLTHTAYAQSWIKAGPYLQERTANAVTVVFENNIKSFSWVEVRKKGSTDAVSFFEDRDGQHQLYSQIVAPQVAVPLQNFAIRINGLQNHTEYEYRVCAQVVNWIEPYSASMGEVHQGEWHSFQTLDSLSTTHHLVVVSDLHRRPEVLEQLLTALDHQSADHIIYAGDMMDNMQISPNEARSPEEPYASFINQSVACFAQSKDFHMLRGEHETQGDIAHHFRQYFPHQSGRLYNAYRWGDLMVVLLDGGAAEADGDPMGQTTNLGAFRQYRAEEAQWLAALIQTEEYRTAKYHIVVSHLPIPNDRKDALDAGTTHFSELMLPLLNQANVDLLICGHRHPKSFTMIKKNSRGNRFPVLVQGYHFGARIDIENGIITIKTAGNGVKSKTRHLKTTRK